MYALPFLPDRSWLTHLQILPTLGCSLQVLTAIASLVTTALEIERDNDPRTELLDKIERSLKYAQQEIKIEELDESGGAHAMQRLRDIAELYRLAGLIYLQRAGRKCRSSNAALQAATESAFKILNGLETCERTFPLFIVSCEARDETQKATVLRLLSTTQERYAPGNIFLVHDFIERFWATNELDVGQYIDYSHRMTIVLSSRDTLPAFT